jgi:5-methylcytosine-specific restriction enzyme subunit McrC
MKNREIRVFEHETLRIGGEDNELNENEFESLCRFYEEADKRYFSLERRKIKFKHYVGVIQVGNLTIEVLPKVDKGQEDTDKWHGALVKMLQYTQKIRSFSTTESTLSISKQSLLDLYFDQYMHEVDKLFKDGLRKKYSFRESNLNKLKGRIVFNSHINKNIVNKNKTYCKYQAFNFDHDIHSAVKMALRITKDIARNSGLRTKAKKLLLILPDEVRDSISITKFNQIKLDRTTKRYEKVLNLASLIIQSYCPIFTAGRMSVLAFMFDMNHLFEEFIFKIMKKGFVGSEIDVSRKNKKFWENKIIKPDIVVTNSGETIVLDAKWKVPLNGIPSDNDLKQIYVYNNYFESPVSYLLYPDTAIFSESRYDEGEGAYQKDLFIENGTVPHYCKIRTVNFFNSKDRLDIPGIRETLAKLIEKEPTATSETVSRSS